MSDFLVIFRLKELDNAQRDQKQAAGTKNAIEVRYDFQPQNIVLSLYLPLPVVSRSNLVHIAIV